MELRTAALLAPAILILAAGGSSPVRAADALSDTHYSYQRDVKPILERHCIVCHACYDAPCQLKMESSEGLDRGASKAVVYKARPKAQDTTRLHIDATNTAAWRQKGFFSVIEGGSSSLLSRMLELGRRQAPKANEPIPATVPMGPKRENVCPKAEEFDSYQHRRMHEGMPFGLAPLRPDALLTLQGWLAQGAPLDDPETPPSDQAMEIVARWEQFLDAPDNRSQLLARYIYEHLFLAHLYFDRTASSGFFEIVRSTTPPGSPIQIVPTRRPNDDPGGPIFYRLRPIRDSIVQKTHITYPFGPERLEHIKQLFAQVAWKVDELPSYSLDDSTNPFKTFAAIPARLRYQFMLDNAYYFVQCFIRGPVCLGNIATDVIQDHFYAMFQRPASDLFCQDADYARQAVEHLDVKGREGFKIDVRPEWLASEQRYGKLRLARYKNQEATSLEDIWNGDGSNPDAMLTIFRNFDSATVIRGLRGQDPKTLWVMDYPIFERIYYLLVVTFDVFGSAYHQVVTRSYFDLLRAESETNFLRFMPKEARKPLRDSWYRGTGASLKTLAVYPSVDDETPNRLAFAATDPKAEFIAQLRARMTPIAGAAGDLTGNSFAENDRVLDATMRQAVDGALQSLEAGTASEHPFISFLPEVTFVRVGIGDKTQDLAYTVLHSRSLKNVAFMFQETRRQEPEMDYLTVLRGPVGCYPNFIFQIPLAKTDDFVKLLAAVTDQDSFNSVIREYGVLRTHPSFWDAFDFIKKYQSRLNPVECGIFDANRYANY
ncbi:MAG: fatty acid cis/trans isomerase [Candidatus Wallbacteria bacterium]|nr:fatty acid cis/trans isomerase [Candidatus Wallbacteria bacterium]